MPDDSAIAAPPLAGSHAAMLAAFVLAVGVGVTVIAGPHAVAVIAGWLGDAAILAAWLLAAWAIGSPLAPRGDERDAALRHVTAVALGLGAISLIVLLLGWAGVLSRPIAWAILAGGAIAGVLRMRRQSAALNAWLVRPAGGAWLAIACAPAIAVSVVAARVVPGFLWGDEPSGYDVASYHLQLPREWFELGRVTPLRHNVFSFMPLAVEMHALLAMHLRGAAHGAGMYLAQTMCGAFALLVPAACYAIVRPLAGRWSGAAAACLAMAAPWTAMLGGIAYNDPGLMLYATLAAAWALRGRWAIAGGLAGLAAGCKYTGVMSAIVLVPIVAGIMAFRGTGVPPVVTSPPRSGRDATEANHGRDARATKWVASLASIATYLAVALLVFSPWLIRNAIYANGNPIFPLAMRALGPAHFDAGQVERFEVAHAPRDDQRSTAARLTALWQQVGGDWRYGATGPVPTLFVLAIVAVAIRPNRQSLAWLALIVGNAIVWLTATHLQGRFLVQAIPCAAIAATLAPRFGRRQAIATVGVALVAGGLAYREPLRRLGGPILLTVGVDDLRPFWDDDVRRALDDAPRAVVIVGDVRPFLLPIDARRMRYRTVFDLPTGTSFHDAWAGV